MDPMNILVNISAVNVALILICLALCLYYHYASYKNKLKGHIDNGAQYATTTGVFFTFVGITMALLSFDTQDIEGSIKGFISGMSLAFITSLIGIFVGYFIRKMQDSVEMGASDDISFNIRTTAENSHYLKKLVANQENDSNQLLLSAIIKLEESVKISSSGQLSQEIQKLSESLQEYVHASKASNKALESIPAKIEDQSTVIRELATKLEESNNALAKELKTFNVGQIQRLDRMNDTISDMKDFSNKMYENSNKTLEESRSFQVESLGYSNKQITILQDNTKQIVEMKASFDEFLDKMAKKNNEEFIKALNDSMRNLNQQLTEQFGDNFKELNYAVGKLLEWQKEYRQIIKETTEELHFINSVFSQFSTDIQPQLNQMSDSIKLFSDTSEKNVDIQNNLLATTNQLRDVVYNTTKICGSFDSLSKRLIEETVAGIQTISDRIADSMEENQTAISKEMKILGDNISSLHKISNEVYMSTENSMKQFNKSSENVMKNIGDTLERFDIDFKEEIEKSMNKLTADLKAISENTNKQGDIAVKTLAATLGKITERMTGNYIALVDRIEKIDKLLSNR